MLRRLLIALGAWLALAAPAAAQCFGASAELALDGSGTYVMTLGSAVSAGDALLVSVTQLEETSSVLSVADTVNGSWTLTGGVTTFGDDGGGTARAHVVVRTASGSGTPIVTIVMAGGAAGGTGRVWACPAAVSNTFEEWTTSVVGSATNTPAGPAGNATCASGIVTGVIWTNSSRDVASLSTGTNLSPITGRQHLFYQTFGSAGAISAITATLAGGLTARAIGQMAVLCAAGGGGGSPTTGRLLLMGVGP